MDNPVIVADDFSPGAIRILEANAANYADRRRLHIHLPDAGLSVHVEEVGLGPIDSAPRALSSLSGATGAVVLALLEAPEAEHKVTVLAEQAGVSPATAQRVLFGLEADGLLVVAGRGPNKVRTLTDPSELLDRYAADAGADRRLAVPCRIIGDDPIEIVERAAEALGRASVPYCVTGAAAALLEAPALTAVHRPELWVQGPRTPSTCSGSSTASHPMTAATSSCGAPPRAGRWRSAATARTNLISGWHRGSVCTRTCRSARNGTGNKPRSTASGSSAWR